MEDSKDIIVEDVIVEEAPVVEEKPKKKANKEILNKIVCKVNYNLPKKNKTSVSYDKNNSVYSVFIDGIYEGKIEIEYSGKEFLKENIKKIKAL